jgi:hypothetical protein
MQGTLFCGLGERLRILPVGRNKYQTGGGGMTASELKCLYERNNPEGRYFDRKIMRFFGDTMRNFGVRDGGKARTVTGNGVEDVEVWELYRKRPVCGGRHGFAVLFRKDNGKELTNWE